MTSRITCYSVAFKDLYIYIFVDLDGLFFCDFVKRDHEFGTLICI